MTPDEARDTAMRLGRECLSLRMRLLHRVINGIYEDALRPIGVRGGQLSLLLSISAAGPVKPSDLARWLHMDKSTVSRDVDRLVASGWIAVEPDPDGRGQLLTVTQPGRSIIALAVPAWERAQQKAAALLGPEGVRALHDASPSFPPRC
jgi:DNA-binding MarR family transcriptional regulator